jgi:AcrR family transcriptional regulator
VSKATIRCRKKGVTLQTASATRRLNRGEKKAATKARLLEAARTVFARHGFQNATVEQIADQAGFSKGAVYSNFASKEELFMGMLEQHIEERRVQMAQAVSREETYEERAMVGAAQFMEMVRSEPEWILLFLEFTAYASRNPELRPRLAEQLGRFQDTIKQLLEDGVRAFGIKGDVPSDEMAVAVMALGHGIALHELVDPDRVPDELYGVMLTFMLRGGLEWLRESQEASEDGMFHREIGDMTAMGPSWPAQA